MVVRPRGFPGSLCGNNMRAMAYPFVALAILALWWSRGRTAPYPHLLDILVVLPISSTWASTP